MKDPRNLHSPKHRPQRKRNIEITRAYYVAGLTCREIAQEHGLSRARVHQIIQTAVRHHSYSEKLPHLRLPPDIAEKLAKPLPRHMIGQDLTKVWTPQEVEEETLAGYWNRWPGPVRDAKLNAYWAAQKARDTGRRSWGHTMEDAMNLVRLHLAQQTPTRLERIEDYMREVGIL